MLDKLQRWLFYLMKKLVRKTMSKLPNDNVWIETEKCPLSLRLTPDGTVAKPQLEQKASL